MDYDDDDDDDVDDNDYNESDNIIPWAGQTVRSAPEIPKKVPSPGKFIRPWEDDDDNIDDDDDDKDDDNNEIENVKSCLGQTAWSSSEAPQK